MTDYEKTLREGLLITVGYAITTTALAVASSGGVHAEGIAKMFMRFEGGFFMGPILNGIWGWPVWWAGIFMVIAWLGSFVWFVWSIAGDRVEKAAEKKKNGTPRLTID